MSDVEEGNSPLEVLQATHRKEKKDLKEKCLALKKAAKCGNKQKQKEVAVEIENLEKKLEDRHSKEIEELSKDLTKTSINEAKPSPIVQLEGVDETTTFYKENNISSKTKKKQAKKSEAANRLKAAADQDREDSLTSLKTIENTALVEILTKRGLKLYEIRPDGDCLYNSIAHQLNRAANFTLEGKDVRRRAARFMLDNREDFAPFLTNDDGESLDDFEYEGYCQKVENESKDGGVWGGEPELIAISKSMERKIEVIQPEGRCIIYGEEYSTKPLTIVYQRHAYQLGEHYNSTEPLKTL